jgi:hypothetical protein
MSESEESIMNQDDEGQAGRPAWELPGELKSLEARLMALSPRDDRLDRERHMFLAGQASVESAASPQVGRELGRRPNAWPWQAAFAGMTTVAATLLVVLITRPAITDGSSPPAVREFASDTRPRALRQPLQDEVVATKPGVLSAGDARHGDIEQLLAARSDIPAESDPVDDRARPTLTPASWREVINDTESADSPTDDSSSLPTYQGINS